MIMNHAILGVEFRMRSTRHHGKDDSGLKGPYLRAGGTHRRKYPGRHIYLNSTA